MNKGQKIVAGLVLGSGSLLGAMAMWERPPAEVAGGTPGPSVVYADKLAGGLPTVCSGHTDWKLRVGTPYTKEECDRIDKGNAEKYGLAIIKCSGHTDTNPVFRNQYEFDAHTLNAINIGIAGKCGARSMKLLKAGRHEEACDAIAHAPSGKPVWSYVKKKGVFVYVHGLYNRRLFERDWCLKPTPDKGGVLT